MSKYSLKPILIGICSSVGILLVYFITMRILSGSWQATFFQFQKLWFYMLPLSIGFGVQVGFYQFIKYKIARSASKSVITTNTTSSTIAMIACCAHHLTDILPVLGLSAVSVFLVNFQVPIIIFAIISNFFGLIYLFRIYINFTSSVIEMGDASEGFPNEDVS